MFQSNELSQQDHDCPKLIAQRIQVSEVDSMIDPILQVWLLGTLKVPLIVNDKNFHIVVHYTF